MGEGAEGEGGGDREASTGPGEHIRASPSFHLPDPGRLSG